MFRPTDVCAPLAAVGSTQNYVRLAVTGADYPAVVPTDDLPATTAASLRPEDKVVRGTYVTGLSEADVKALDIFEGDVRAL